MPRPPMGGPMLHRGKDEFAEFDLLQMEKETNEMIKLTRLTKENCVFETTSGGFMSLSLNTKENEKEFFKQVLFFNSFPLTDTDHFISVRECDDREKFKEIGMIFDLENDFDPQTVQSIREQQKTRYFRPKITHINSIKEEYGYAYFDVETTSGRCKFATHSNGSVIPLSDTRIIINDLDGNRFEIEDLSTFSPKELKKLDVFL